MADNCKVATKINYYGPMNESKKHRCIIIPRGKMVVWGKFEIPKPKYKIN
jgi:hypothetical protein